MVRVGAGAVTVAVGVRRGAVRDCVGAAAGGDVRVSIGDGVPLWAGDRVTVGPGNRGERLVVGVPDAREELLDGPNSVNTTHAPRPKKTAAMRILASSCIPPPPGQATRALGSPRSFFT
jgi:hypothetical protein